MSVEIEDHSLEDTLTNRQDTSDDENLNVGANNFRELFQNDVQQSIEVMEDNPLFNAGTVESILAAPSESNGFQTDVKNSTSTIIPDNSIPTDDLVTQN